MKKLRNIADSILKQPLWKKILLALVVVLTLVSALFFQPLQVARCYLGKIPCPDAFKSFCVSSPPSTSCGSAFDCSDPSPPSCGIGGFAFDASTFT